ncbi:hypothetical protein V5O48_005743 [Marasmius crinis-equi]|uniref:BTB domain-containing protein n=1 Tax=Marasmius crinis-equi TaxID=585013 RepID=A0ABR3FM51_9AGAR
MEVEPSATSLVSPVFNDARADVILRTVDGVDFRMHKSLLSFASPFFEGMFSLPQPDKPSTTALQNHDGLSIVPMPESSKVVEKLLMFCHPAHAPVLESLDEVRLVIEPALKYDMAGIVKRIIAQLEPIIFEEPLRSYCVSWQFKLTDQVQKAAKLLLRQPLLPRRFVRELDLIPATALHRLHEYHYNCGKAARAVATAFGWIDMSSYIRFGAGGPCFDCSNEETMTGYDNQAIPARSWWVEYMHEAASLLQERPCGATVKDPELLNRTFRKAVQCRYCKERVLMEMLEFTEDFAKEVERTTDMITLDVEF